MTARDFCFWLNGFFELDGAENGIGIKQAGLIKRHLDLVFVHEIDAAIDKGDPLKKKELDAIHGGDVIMRC